jgi:lysophospholipase L1-like esterase
MKYLNSIGEAAGDKFSPMTDDKTHLSPRGTVVFGRMVAELIGRRLPELKGDFGSGKG